MFKTDGCTGIPFQTWFEPCCVAHDFAEYSQIPDAIADPQFLQCVAEQSSFLGAGAYVFAGIIVSVMALFRPVHRFLKKMKTKN